MWHASSIDIKKNSSIFFFPSRAMWLCSIILANIHYICSSHMAEVKNSSTLKILSPFLTAHIVWRKIFSHGEFIMINKFKHRIISTQTPFIFRHDKHRDIYHTQNCDSKKIYVMNETAKIFVLKAIYARLGMKIAL